jgi:competence protein CoiA
MIERPLGSVRPDVSAYIHGMPVAIEIQISNLSQEKIRARTTEYFKKGIAVLWLLPWTEELENPRYSPTHWEKWIHACYFGRVYYWLHALTVVSYHFEPTLKSTRAKTWYGRDGKERLFKGFTRRLHRTRTPVRGSSVHLARDFTPRQRYWWEGGGIKVPDAKLFMDKKTQYPK